MANKDHSALSHMLDSASFSDEVFGFHAQQTIEKALKAWIAVRGLVYPKSHDVSALVKILHDDGQDLSNFPDLEDYTVFAVQYRYEAYDGADDINRAEAIEKTRTFLAHVKEILDSPT
jgi:HEPN domain-containing protein